MAYRRNISLTTTASNAKVSIDLSVSELTVFYINNNKLNELKKIVDTSNVNNIIDSRLGYRALDYAIKSDNKEIIDYLLSLCADPYLLNGDRKNAFTMSRDYMSNHVVLNVLNLKDGIIKDKNKTITTLEKSIANLEASKTYMLKSIGVLNASNSEFKKETTDLKGETRTLKDEVSSLSVKTRSMTTKINQLENQSSNIRSENNVLKSSISSLHIENDNLKKENVVLKRKYSELEQSFDTLFQSTKNNKK